MKTKKDIIEILNQYKKDNPEYKDYVINEKSSMLEREGEEACEEITKLIKKLNVKYETNISRNIRNDY